MVEEFQTYSDFVSDKENADAVKAACATNYKYEDGTTVDEDGSILSELIKKRYKYRRLGWKDPEKFLYYFCNNIETFKDQYMQLLRNQPGFADYDFTVQRYTERQIKLKSDTKNKRSQGADEDIRNISDTKTTELTHGEIIDRTKNGEKTYMGQEQTADSGSDSDTHTGGYKDTKVEGKHTSEYSPHVSVVTQNGGHRSAWAGNQSIQAALPQSKEYSTFIEPDESTGIEEGDGGYKRAYQHMPALKWDTATAQAQDGHREYGVDKSNVKQSYEYGSDGAGDITERNGDKSNPDTATREYENEKQEKIYGKTQTRSFTGRKDVQTEAANDIHSGKDVTIESDTKHDSVSHTHGSIEDSGSEESTNREISTGRDLDLATLLTRAQGFIQRSNAWIWLRQQLDPCFLSNLE
jgi:hypothetical protein